MAEEQKVPAAEAAVKVGVTRETLVRRIQKGDVRGQCIDGRWVLPLSEVERLSALPEMVRSIQEEAAEKRATEKAAESERQAHLKKVADLTMNGPPLPPSIAPMAIPARRKSND